MSPGGFAPLVRSAIESIALTDATTSGAVLIPVRQAFDLDYDITMVRGACTDSDGAVNDVIFDGLLSARAIAA
ncbi:hypothetical protein LRM36_12785 [Stenotrophomonas maltophilia]|nr:hypothetical protein [Stenotrophomonas maltophilia]